MDCCDPVAEASDGHCPKCHSQARSVPFVTVQALLTSHALERLLPRTHRFCATPDCDVVYFSDETCFGVGDVRVPVSQKEPPGRRVVCYCFEITDVDADVSAEARVRAHVRAGRCACEVRNPEGTCCLGKLRALARPSAAEVSSED